MVLHLHIPHKIDLFSYPKLYIGEEFPNKKRKKTVWEDYTLEKYKQDVIKYTEEHSDKVGLKAKINEIKKLFQNHIGYKRFKE